MPIPKTAYGYEIRDPYEGENSYFKSNPHVAAMAAEDGRITINPFSKNTEEEQLAVIKNEATRLFLMEKQIPLEFDITPEQIKAFKGTPYDIEKDPSMINNLRATILGRAISRDPSVGKLTNEQSALAGWLRPQIEARK